MFFEMIAYKFCDWCIFLFVQSQLLSDVCVLFRAHKQLQTTETIRNWCSSLAASNPDQRAPIVYPATTLCHHGPKPLPFLAAPSPTRLVCRSQMALPRSAIAKTVARLKWRGLSETMFPALWYSALPTYSP